MAIETGKFVMAGCNYSNPDDDITTTFGPLKTELTREEIIAKISAEDFYKQANPLGGRLEMDPSGKSAKEAGAKLDAGKIEPSLIIEGMARAIWGIAEVATFGANKYSRNGWMAVQDGQYRYTNAGYRHVLKRAMGETVDPDSHLEHLKHEAWNAMAKLDLYMREQEAKLPKENSKKYLDTPSVYD